MQKINKKGFLEINLENWNNERMYWGKSRDEYYNNSKNNGYLLLSAQQIIKNISDLIEKL